MPKAAKGPHRWVAKRPRCDDKSKDPSQAAGADGDLDSELENFQADWGSPTDGGASSTKDYYFDSYAQFGIHEDMLKDTVRTGTYQRAIMENRHLFRDKVVLDVGSGTGILCLFAAQAGAKLCIGVEYTDIADFAKMIAEKNGFAETVVFVKGKVEEVDLPVPQVDIIISEWMGYFLIYESMLDSVLFARDKWLKAGGLLFPDQAKIYMAAIEDADYKEEKIGFWTHLWGFDFTPMQKHVMQEPISDFVNEEAIATSTCCLLDVDLTTCCKEDLDFFAEYSLKVTRKDLLHAMVVWFDVTFGGSPAHRAAHGAMPVVLSTAPHKPGTHWKQTVFYLNEVLAAFPGEELCGMLAVRKSASNPRDLDVKLSFELKGKHAVSERTLYYRLR
eukprot:TRINITY_DN55176_c0_g1_i1.p1 TRINITY_DN55176_c0_g1~~TRINITY_DN55176_c0_g1_i1.p1  ORF type:complete len:388 (+),score=61.50 TRINITY_DN55176_c0_g1_i1:111-1274(+)